MRRLSAFVCGCTVVAFVLAIGRAEAQPAKKSDELVIDHAVRTARYGNRDVEDGDKIRSVHKAIDVVVNNSNSALYDCQVGLEKTSVPEVDAALGFLKALGPYLVEAAVVGTEKNRPTYLAHIEAAKLTDPAKPVYEQLQRINAALLDPTGLHVLLARTMYELDRMRALKLGRDFSTADYQKFVLPACVTDGQDCVRLRNTEILADALNRLGILYSALATKPNPTSTDSQLVAKAAEALADADGLLGMAYGVERVVRRTFSATHTLKCSRPITMSAYSGRDATITVSPNDISQTSRTTNAEPYVLKVNARADWFWRPTLGLSFMSSRHARPPKFVARQTDSTSFTISKAGYTDNRFWYGLTLASSWRCVDWRDGKYAIALYVPELTVNPTEGGRAVAVGVGVSWRMLKVGIGRSWTKFAALAETLRVGSILRNAEALSTQDSYGHGKFYLSFSIVGLPPFVQ